MYDGDATNAVHGGSIVRLACFQVRAASVEIDSGTLHSCFVWSCLYSECM